MALNDCLIETRGVDLENPGKLPGENPSAKFSIKATFGVPKKSGTSVTVTAAVMLVMTP